MTRAWATPDYEHELYIKGIHLVAGADEVGRGALAGPLVVGMVILPPEHSLRLRDSKLLSASRRVQLAAEIEAIAIAATLGIVQAREVDALGMARALRTAYVRAFEQLSCNVSEVIVDGNHNYLADFGIGRAIIKADQQHSCVAAASILAKVWRDTHMMSLAEQYPGYSFEQHVGYGTKAHIAAMKELGLTDIHRRSFKVAALNN